MKSKEEILCESLYYYNSLHNKITFKIGETNKVIWTNDKETEIISANGYWTANYKYTSYTVKLTTYNIYMILEEYYNTDLDNINSMTPKQYHFYECAKYFIQSMERYINEE